MNRLKHEIKLNFKKKIFINEMLLVQLILCFVMCAFALVTENDIKNQAASFKKNYGDKQFLRVTDKFDNMYEDDFFYTPNYIGKMIYAYEQMKNNKKLNFYSQANNPVYIENAPNDIRFCKSPPENEDSFSVEEYAIDLEAYDGNIHYYNGVKCIWIGQGGMEANGIKITDGRGFEEQDFEYYTDGDTIPVIMGNDYKEYYKIDDTFKADMFFVNLNFKVIGFFDKGEAIYMKQLRSGFYELDDYLMIPICDTPDEISEQDHDALLGLYDFKIRGYCATGLSPNDAQSEVKEICKNVGFDPPLLVCDSSNYESREIMMDMDSFSTVITLLSVILVFFAVMTIILFTINSIKKNLRYYAILLANGFTYSDIILLITAPPILLSLAAFVLSGIAVIVVCELAYWQIIIKSLIMLLGVVLIIDVICSASAYNELKKYDLAIYLRKK